MLAVVSLPLLAVGLAGSTSAFGRLALHIEESGGLVAGLSDGFTSEGVRGLHVTEAIAAGEPLLVLPPGTYIATDGDGASEIAGSMAALAL